ncbi:hypothetical protein PVK06_030334 [Gossypium arboreum]|uniref:Uncharacterized protein n=1 Tax=Gossypium arboreum TaxID=29729 RepID=A0ABR0NNX1_GOSAR|nr:hypothetical protein PVK06_030334 [Gossypium arboreum]
MTNLEDLLGGQVVLALQSVILKLMNSQQKTGTLVKEHMLKLMGFFVVAENNGVELEVNTQIEIVFKSLTKEFVGFRVSYNLGNKALTLTQLIKELKSYKLMLNGGKSVQEKPEANLLWAPCPLRGNKRLREKRNRLSL